MGDESDLAREADPLQGHEEEEDLVEGQDEKESLEREMENSSAGEIFFFLRKIKSFEIVE